jgi:hypothetical protein
LTYRLGIASRQLPTDHIRSVYFSTAQICDPPTGWTVGGPVLQYLRDFIDEAFMLFCPDSWWNALNRWDQLLHSMGPFAPTRAAPMLQDTPCLARGVSWLNQSPLLLSDLVWSRPKGIQMIEPTLQPRYGMAPVHIAHRLGDLYLPWPTGLPSSSHVMLSMSALRWAQTLEEEPALCSYCPKKLLLSHVVASAQSSDSCGASVVDKPKVGKHVKSNQKSRRRLCARNYVQP